MTKYLNTKRLRVNELSDKFEFYFNHNSLEFFVFKLVHKVFLQKQNFRQGLMRMKDLITNLNSNWLAMKTAKKKHLESCAGRRSS